MIFDNERLFLIAGPCVIENYEQMESVASRLIDICEKENIQYIFKASFDKANRSSLDAYRGPGVQEGLSYIKKIKEKFKIPVLSDIHTPEQVKEVVDILDIIQIPAFLARQTDFYKETGRLGATINIKKGQFMSPYEMENAIKKFKDSGGSEVTVTERGTFFGYGNLVVDFRSISILKSMGVKYIFDATHSVQLPAARGSSSGGAREFIPSLIKAQLAGGADGLFMEVHPDPGVALCDSETQYPLDKMDDLLHEISQLFYFLKKN